MAIGTGAALALGGAALAKGAMSYMSAKEKRKAQERAAKRAGNLQQLGSQNAAESLKIGYGDAERSLGQGFDQSTGALSAWNAKSGEALTSGRDLARRDLSEGYDQGTKRLQSLSDLAHYGEDALTGKGFETSAGYGFRLGQGQSALNRMSAASGGRLSGAALKKASEYNQGFASNEFGNWANRAAQLGQVGYGAIGQQSGLDVSRGGALGQLESNYGGQMSQLMERYGGNLANLYGQRGTQLANLQTGLAGGLANAYTGNANNQANLQFAGTDQAGAGYDAAGNFIGDLGQIGALYDWSGGSSTPAAGKMSNTLKPKPIG